MGSREQLACIVLVHGSLCGWGHALAQGFNKRYDTIGQSLAQEGYSIERSGQNFLVLGNTELITADSFYYNPVVCTLLLGPEGEFMASDTFFYEWHALAPGTWNCMAPRGSGGFLAGGGTVSQLEVYRPALWLVDPSGVVSLLAEYGSADYFSTSRQAIECKNGDFLLVGESESQGTPDASLIRTDSTGAVLWSRTYGDELQDRGWTVDTTADDGFFMGGQYGYGNSGSYGRQWVLRVDADGDTVWQRIWGGEMTNQTALLTTKASGNPVICGATELVENTNRRCYMAEMDASNGDLLWERHYDNMGDDMLLLIAKEVSPGAGHVAVGWVTDSQQGNYKSVMLRTADNGDSLWMRSFVYQDTLMSIGQGLLNDVVPTLDGGFIACGTAYNELGTPYPPGYSQDIWVVKVDSLGCIEPGCNIPLGITTQITNLKGALALSPNPVASGGEVNVHITLPDVLRKEALRLCVVSTEGKLMAERNLPSRSTAIALHTSGLANGLYHLHLISGGTWVAGAKLIVE